MKPFTYVRADHEELALTAAREPEAIFIAGGTTVVDLMRLDVMQPKQLIDITRLPLTAIEPLGDGVRIGALARNTEVAYHPLIVERYPVLSQALLSGASAQLRNMATVGGNILQRTRCPYFRDPTQACNKRQPGAGCAALAGFTRSHAVLGTSASCIASNPSDMNVALAALDAILHLRGPDGTRQVPFLDFHTLPDAHPEIESVLKPGELITHVELPACLFAKRSCYVKVRDRASFAFALASAAAALDVQDGTIRQARLALGGVATRPWRCREAEALLLGKKANAATFKQAATAALQGATPRRDNGFKVELAQRTIVRALSEAGGAT